MNYLEEQTDGKAMINLIKNGDQPLPRVTQVSIARTSSTKQPPLKDKSMWSDQEKQFQKIDRLARSLLIQGLSNDIYSLIDSNKTAKDLWDALARHMLGSEYGEQDRKAAILYEYETFKATKGELLLDTYIRYIQVINDLKKCGYSKDNFELNFKFLNNLQLEWKQKKTIVVTFDPLALIAEKMKVSKRKEKVVVSLDSEGSDADDFNELKKITALLANAFNRRKFYSKLTNNNLRTSSTYQSANKKQEFVKSDDKKVKKKDDEKKRDMSKVKCYNCKKEGNFTKDRKKAKVKDYEYYTTKMLLAKKDKDEQVLLAEDQAWMESSKASSSSADDEIFEVSYYLSKPESESEYETLEYYDNTTMSYFCKAKDLRPTLYDERVINLGYTPMFLTHSDEALETKKFKRAKENKIEFAYDYGKLNASYVNGKINFSDDYFQEIINPDFEKIDSPFQQTSSLKLAFDCNNARNALCNAKMNASVDVNDSFVFDDMSIRKSHVSKMPFRKKTSASLIVPSRSKLNKSLPRFVRKWLPKLQLLAEPIFLWIIDSGCSKHMTGNRALLTNFVEKFFGTVCFGNNDFAVIVGYGDVVIGSMTIKKVYYSTCFVQNKDGVDLLTGDRSLNLYTIALNEVALNSSTSLLAKASSLQSWLWHQHLSHLNFATINNLVKNNLVQGLLKMKFKKDHLCSACEQGKIHQKHHKSKTAFALNKPLYLLHMDLCGLMHVESINRKRYVLVVVNDYSRYTWRVRTDNGTEFKNKTLAKFFDEVGITQQFSAARTPQQNGVVERRNRTFVEAARNMLTFANLPLFLWAKAITTTCFTQNHLIIHKRFDKTLYELTNKRKPNIKFFRVFGCRCYLLNDYEDVGKLKAKRDIRVFVRYSKESVAFRIYNKRTRKSLNPVVSQVSKTSKKDLKDLFHNFYDEYFDASKIMKSSTMNVETSNVKIPSHEEEVFHESFESFQEEYSLSSLNDDVQQSSEEVEVPSSNT
nr:hypothetical protein [Tanacetum cinerariifolium]